MLQGTSQAVILEISTSLPQGVEDDISVQNAWRLEELTELLYTKIGKRKCSSTRITIMLEDLKILNRIFGLFSAPQGWRHSHGY